MAKSVAGDRILTRTARQKKLQPNVPLQTDNGRIPKPGAAEALSFMDWQHPIYKAWRARWELNEARLAGGDEVLSELRPFVWEQDNTETGALAKRKAEAIYTNFPDIFVTSITSHLIRFSPTPDKGFTIPTLGKVVGRSSTPTRAEQLWYSIDNPSGAGSEWNTWWMDAAKRAAATGHRWLFVDTPGEEPKNQEDERKRGLRPYLVEFSPIDVPNWYINPRGIIEFVVIRTKDEDPSVERGSFNVNSPEQAGYLLLVREGCTRLGERFAGGGWWKFNSNKAELDRATWDDTDGEIPISLLFYQKHKGTKNYPAISRPGITELGQAAIAHMNQTSSANYNSWAAGGSVDYLAGIDEDGMELVKRMELAGSRRIPLAPHGETDAVPTVITSGAGAVQSEIFSAREDSIWDAAVRLGIIEASAPVGNSGAAAEASFKGGQMPRVVWLAQNIAEAQNNTIRYLELRYGIAKPSGQVLWPTKFDLVELVDRIRKYFEIERLAGIRSKTVDARAMTQATQEAGFVADPQEIAKFQKEFEESAANRDKIEQQAALATSLKPMQKTGPATKQANREALKKSTKTRGKAGRPGPNQKPVNKSAPGVKR